ncbi:TM0106 family RecB-like putative nuclease [Spirulina sp. CCNP1310]|uniref:TM0106 family RecB-like putative nuclease n=1 Tax=Spirulina sp. CCNP1310 TaxID=3110249 RepID=UPI002B203762|nr:TM0106 family RecB-like putative nuclease [Spirulina sp. CCNP1310]MEA5421526.1 TM0106 family RecB-like putative nuclease [Spirulina sp. CCNP1310]
MGNSMILLTDDLLLDYARCHRRAHLHHWGDRHHRAPEKDFVLKLRREHQQQIQTVLAGQRVATPEYSPQDWSAGAVATETLMAAGVEQIHRGILRWTEPLEELPQPEGLELVGRPTLLVKQPGVSRFGNWCYQPVNIKLGKRPKSEYKLVAMFQGLMLTHIQGATPPDPQLILREGSTHGVDSGYWWGKMLAAVTDCVRALRDAEAPEVFISRQRCSLCPWYDHCHGVAVATQHLSLVPGVTPGRYASLQGLGVTSLAQLAALEPQQVEPDIEPAIARHLQRQAQAIVENRPLPLGTAHPSPQPLAPIELYFDLEAEPDQDVDFLFGVFCVNHDKQTETFHGFFAEHPRDEPLIWQQFLALLHRYPTAPIFHFSPYEVETVKRLSQRYRMSQYPMRSLLPRFIDVHAWLMAVAVLPVENYSLKSVAKWLGFTWRDQGLSGDQTVCLYNQWLETADQEALAMILRYNEDDCRATHQLRMWLHDWSLRGETNFANILDRV